jgi:glycosyltransferase involved in cell wall biosynthesis
MIISIATLMAVYHGDDPILLAAAIDSIVAQQFSQDVESRIYLAIDGPVREELKDVIAARAGLIHCIVRIERNAGLANALNTLISLLKDEVYIFRMDADDVSLPTRYQTQLDRLEWDDGIDILGTDIVEIDEVSGRQRRVSFAHDHDDALAKLCWRVPVAHPTVCFRRRVLLSIPGYPTTGTNEDVALWFLCAKLGFRFGNVHEPLLLFRIGPDFWRRRSFAKAVSELRCYVRGIWALQGVTWKYVLPLMRFGLRIAPERISKWAYALASVRSTRR